MITYGVIQVFVLVLTPVFGALPSASPLGLNDLATTVTGSGFFAHFGWANDYFPLDSAMVVAAVLLAMSVFMSGVQLVLWALTKLHVLGGAGGGG